MSKKQIDIELARLIAEMMVARALIGNRISFDEALKLAEQILGEPLDAERLAD